MKQSSTNIKFQSKRKSIKIEDNCLFCKKNNF